MLSRGSIVIKIKLAYRTFFDILAMCRRLSMFKRFKGLQIWPDISKNQISNIHTLVYVLYSRKALNILDTPYSKKIFTCYLMKLDDQSTPHYNANYSKLFLLSQLAKNNKLGYPVVGSFIKQSFSKCNNRLSLPFSSSRSLTWKRFFLNI